MSGLKADWSPEQVAGRLAWERGRRVVSPETIYRFVHAQGRRGKDYAWFRLLPQGRTKRGRRRGHPASQIRLRRPLAERPQEAEGRSVPGHWEADLMLCGNRGQSLLVMQERHSRLILGQVMLRKSAEPLARVMSQLLECLPPQWRRTVTLDNGSEFAQHYRLHELGVETFFCDTHSPWQKGGVENASRRLRRYLPRKTDLAKLPEAVALGVFQACNNTPRKRLGYRTPAEIFSDQVLRLKCESTFPLSPE